MPLSLLYLLPLLAAAQTTLPPAQTTLPPALTTSRPVQTTLPPAQTTLADDIDEEGPCKTALEQNCRDVPKGHGKKAGCLTAVVRSNREALRKDVANEVSRSCKSALRKWNLQAVTKGSILAPVFGLAKACGAVIQTKCANATAIMKVPCLKKIHKQDRHALPKACSEALFRTKQSQAADIKLDVQLWEGCGADFDKIEDCKGVTSSPGAKKACLAKHRSQLSSKCRESLFSRHQDDAEDIRLNQKYFQTCKPEIGKFCADKEFGEARVAKCLWEKTDQTGFSRLCKQEVHRFVNRSTSDYRLDYRIRTRCERAIDALCLEEKIRVDRLPVTELFGEHWKNGKSGEVLQCLKASFGKIREDDCQAEVKRLVTVHAVAPLFSPIFKRACFEDAGRFCKDVDPPAVHLCLRKHLKELSPRCKAQELIQGSLASRDIGMKPSMMRLCKSTLEKFCKDVQHGNSRAVQCLQDNLEKEGYDRSCRHAVQEDLEASNKDWRLKFGIHESCKGTVDKYCAHEQQGAGFVLNCLKRHHSVIESQDCKAEVRRFIQQGANNIKNAPLTYERCMLDAEIYCSEVEPGRGRVHKCLLANKQVLSQECREAEFEEQRIISESIDNNPLAAKACATSLKALCGDVPSAPGAKWNCLSDHQGDAKMALPCKEVVAAHVKRTNFEFLLNPELSKHCADDADKLCTFEVALAKFKDFSSEGQVISCLSSKRKNITSQSCRSSLLRKEVQRTRNIENDPSAQSECKEDLDKFCKQVKPGDQRARKCLTEHMKELSKGCTEVHRKYLARTFQDVRLNMPVMITCGKAMKDFCSNEQKGTGAVLKCLQLHMHDDTMSPACRKSLEGSQKIQATSIAFNPFLKDNCAMDLIKLNAGKKCEELRNKPGGNISCLIRNRKDIKNNDCKVKILSQQRIQSMDVRAKPRMQDVCGKAISSMCRGISYGNGRMHACLRDKLAKISNKECARMVQEVWDWESSNVMLNPAVRTSCQNEKDTFCKEVNVGESRMLICLKGHAEAAGFSNKCKAALDKLKPSPTVLAAIKSLKAARAVLRNATGAGLQQNSASDIIAYLKSHKGFWDKWGLPILALLVISCGLVACLIVRSRRKTIYDIEVAQTDNVPPEKIPC